MLGLTPGGADAASVPGGTQIAQVSANFAWTLPSGIGHDTVANGPLCYQLSREDFPMTQLLLLFIAAAGVLTITPGVDTAMVLRTSAAAGPRAGAAASLGICLGLLAWGAGAAFGLTALLAASAPAFTLVKWAGAAYLLFLGARLILKPRTSLAADTAVGGAVTRRGTADAFQRGFLSNILNPKVGIFYVTFLPQFIPHGVNIAAFSLFL